MQSRYTAYACSTTVYPYNELNDDDNTAGAVVSRGERDEATYRCNNSHTKIASVYYALCRTPRYVLNIIRVLCSGNTYPYYTLLYGGG